MVVRGPTQTPGWQEAPCSVDVRLFGFHSKQRIAPIFKSARNADRIAEMVAIIFSLFIHIFKPGARGEAVLPLWELAECVRIALDCGFYHLTPWDTADFVMPRTSFWNLPWGTYPASEPEQGLPSMPGVPGIFPSWELLRTLSSPFTEENKTHLRVWWGEGQK